MQSYLEKVYGSGVRVPYDVSVYGLFRPESIPTQALSPMGLSVRSATLPFQLERPGGRQAFEAFVFDFVMDSFPDRWLDFVTSIFRSLDELSCALGWISLDPGFDFETLFDEHFAAHTFAYFERGRPVRYVSSVEALHGLNWATEIALLRRYL
ncbi:MAG: hypothetical protein ABI459_04800 [Deltaproteobacteria bacterium]